MTAAAIASAPSRARRSAARTATGVIPLLIDARIRLAFLVFGGLFVFQSSQELSVIKDGYLLGAGLAFLAALVHLRDPGMAAHQPQWRPLLALPLLLFPLVGLSGVVAAEHGTSMTSWLRDAAPYILIAAAPIFAFDARPTVSSKALMVAFLAAGMLTTVSFSAEWAWRRELTSLHLYTALPSFLLPAALFSYATSQALYGRSQRGAWIALAALILALVLITGTRSCVVLLAAPPVIALADRRNGGRAWRRLALFGGGAVLLVPIFMLSVAALMDVSGGAFAHRLVSFGRVADLQSDESYTGRAAQTRAAWQAFLAEPALGTGPGYPFEWSDQSGQRQVWLNLDTALSFPAKFGLAGLAALAAIAWAFRSLLGRLASEGYDTTTRAAILGFFAVALFMSPFGSPLEDKGFSFGLLFLLALLLADRAADAGGEQG